MKKESKPVIFALIGFLIGIPISLLVVRNWRNFQLPLEYGVVAMFLIPFALLFLGYCLGKMGHKDVKTSSKNEVQLPGPDAINLDIGTTPNGSAQLSWLAPLCGLGLPVLLRILVSPPMFVDYAVLTLGIVVGLCISFLSLSRAKRSDGSLAHGVVGLIMNALALAFVLLNFIL